MGPAIEETKWLVKEWMANMDAMNHTFKSQAAEVSYQLQVASEVRIVLVKLLEHEILQHLEMQLTQERNCVKAARNLFSGLLNTLETTPLNDADLQELNNFVLDTAEELYCEIVKTKLYFVQKFWNMIQAESNTLAKAKLELSHIILMLIDNVEDVEEAAHIIMTQFSKSTKNIDDLVPDKQCSLISFNMDSTSTS